MKKIILPLLLGCCAPALAQALDARTEQEIAYLVDQLGASGCQFNRNGSWYDASRAVSHLNRKYDYLRKKGLLPNTEAFIQRAASESSSSGRPYLVRCGNAPEVQSGPWFEQALERYRSAASGTGN